MLFQHKSLSDPRWSLIGYTCHSKNHSLTDLGRDLVKVLKLKFYGEADVWLKLKLMLGRDSEDEIWSRFVFELVIWLKKVTLVSRTQPSGPLCLWQCLIAYCGGNLCVLACILHMHRLWDVNSVQQNRKHVVGFLSLERQGGCSKACVCGRLHLLLQISIHAATFSPDVIWKWFIFWWKERALVVERCPLESLWQAGLLLLLPLPSQVDLHLHTTHRFCRGCRAIPKQDKVINMDSAFIFSSNDTSFVVRL